jgi:hypothetical protein
MGAQPRTIRKLAKALGVEPEDLVKTDGSDGSRNGQGLRRNLRQGTYGEISRSGWDFTCG